MGTKTQPVRVPEEMHGPLKTLSAVVGSTPGDLLQKAFNEYIRNHESEFVESFQRAKKYIASADVSGLTDLLGDSRRSRADKAAEAIKARRNQPS